MLVLKITLDSKLIDTKSVKKVLQIFFIIWSYRMNLNIDNESFEINTHTSPRLRKKTLKIFKSKKVFYLQDISKLEKL